MRSLIDIIKTRLPVELIAIGIGYGHDALLPPRCYHRGCRGAGAVRRGSGAGHFGKNSTPCRMSLVADRATLPPPLCRTKCDVPSTTLRERRPWRFRGSHCCSSPLPRRTGTRNTRCWSPSLWRLPLYPSWNLPSAQPRLVLAR